MAKPFLSLLLFVFSINILVFSQPNNECGTNPKSTWNEILKNKNIFQTSPNRGGQLVIIPYQIHLFKTSSGNSNLSLTEIYAEIDSLNYFYANAGLIFIECIAPEIINDDYYYDFDYTLQDADVVSLFYTQNVVNMYFANTVTSWDGSALCGYSQFPPSDDYVVMAANCSTNGSTLAHELGHLFGLPHTHGGSPDELVDGSNCATEGDYICDTPADPTLSNSLVNTSCIYTGTATDANGMPYVPDPNNIMSYSRKNCRNYFSPMQYDVINFTYLNYRNYLVCNVPTTKNEIEIKADILIFPNPGQEVIHFAQNEKRLETSVKFYDVNGSLVYYEIYNSKLFSVNTQSWGKGIYFYQLISQNEVINSGKWIKN